MTEQRASKRQRELLMFVDSFIKGNGFGPSYREIMRALGYKSVSTVATHIDGLIAKGYLIKRDHSARSLEVVTTDTTTSNLPESSADAEHRRWLTGLVNEFLESDSELTEERLQQARTLIGSLGILGFTLEHKKMQTKLDDLLSNPPS